MNNAHPVADPIDPDKFYVYNPATGRMVVSTDGGVRFAAADVLASGGLKRIVPLPNREGHVLRSVRREELKPR